MDCTQAGSVTVVAWQDQSLLGVQEMHPSQAKQVPKFHSRVRKNYALPSSISPIFYNSLYCASKFILRKLAVMYFNFKCKAERFVEKNSNRTSH